MDCALLVTTLIAGGLVLFSAAPRARPRLILHPVACHACGANAPPVVAAARDAYLVETGCIEIETHE
jgi:hypothetical protein